jgi:GDP-L-fucose synthase
MKVLLTGGSGFLGGHVIERLKKTEWCTDIVAPTTAECDLRREDEVEFLFNEVQPDVVIHMAALAGGIGANAEHPAAFLYENLLMGAYTLHHACRTGVKKFVGIGTVCSYPSVTPIPFKEEHLLNGAPDISNAPYGHAKRSLLALSQAYRREHGFNAIHVIPTNMYGPGDHFESAGAHVIPSLIQKFSEAKERGSDSVTLWGDGSPTRDFLYVEDGADGIVLATESYESHEPLNLGSDEETSIKFAAETIASLIGFTGRIEWDTSKPNGQLRRCMDISRARTLIDYHPKHAFRRGIEKTIHWYLAHQTSCLPAGRRAIVA